MLEFKSVNGKLTDVRGRMLSVTVATSNTDVVHDLGYVPIVLVEPNENRVYVVSKTKSKVVLKADTAETSVNILLL